MQRFRVGDRVMVRSRFAKLYPKDGGIIIEVKLDPFRPAFNQYKLQFADDSTADLFEFQIEEVPPET